MHYLQALENLYRNKDHKGPITRNNYGNLVKLVFLEQVWPAPDPFPNHFVSLTEEGKEFCEKKWGHILP